MAERVVARWNPHGLALWRTMRGLGGRESAAVTLVGGGEMWAAALRAELARLRPRVELCTAGEEVFAGGVSGGGVGPVPVALVVLDAGALIGGELVRVVRGLRADGTRIVFALEGIHVHEEWRVVRQRDSELLAGESGGEVEIVPVSARMAAVARVNGDAALLDRSGLALLHARLVAAAGAGAVADQEVIVRERMLAETRRRIEQQIASLRNGGDVAALREERAALLAVNDGGRGPAMAMLRNRLHLARLDLLHEVGVRMRALNSGMRADIERVSKAEYADFPGRLQHGVDKVTYEMDRVMRARLVDVAGQLGEVIGRVEIDTENRAKCVVPERDSRIVGRLPAWPRVGPGPEPRCGGVEDHLMLAFGASAGFGLGRLVVAPLALVQAVDYAVVPVSLLLGAAAAGWVVRARGQLAERAHLQQWVADALVNVKAQVEQRVATALIEAEERLTDAVLATTTAHRIETDRRVGELEAQLRQAAQLRPALRTACERDLAALEFV
ncbi:hypothetical protein ACIP5Y_45930 [Nocardia sp. NPDC088792]|uniref:hypothetical protein n=1 Tax=Nocardia sp. NPDC088792 TaxID=3364332 RepID=UPI0037F85D39